MVEKEPKKTKREGEESYLLEKWNGERIPEVSLAAQPKAFCGCSSSGDFAIIVLLTLSLSLFSDHPSHSLAEH